MVSLATMVSRILGVAREMVMARYFGAGFFTDAYNAAYRIPNLLRDLFAEGALSAAFVPTFTRTLARSGPEAAWLLASRVINALVVVLGGMTLMFYLGARFFVYVLAAGFAETPGKIELAVQLTRIMSPFLLWVSVAAVVMGMLNACGSFFLPALAPSAFNVCSILAGIFLSPLMPRWGLAPIVSMAIGAVAGGAGQFFIQLPAARRRGFRYRFAFGFKDPDLRHIAQLMLPAIVGLSATQINITVDNQLASRLGDGPVSWLNYAFRLMQLPIGLFGVSIATATTVLVSQHAAQNAAARLRNTVASSLRLAACLTFPATVGLIVFRREIVGLLYERGKFVAFDTLRTSEALVFYALALFAYSGVKILVPTFYAMNDTRAPVRASMIAVGVKIVVNLVFIIPLGFLGLPLATAVASWLNMALLVRSLDRKVEGKWTRHDLFPYCKILAASVAMGVLAFGTLRLFLHLTPGTGLLASATRLGAAIGVGVLAIVPLLHAMRVEETREVVGMVTRRLGLPRGTAK